jgi:hypothetical protein
MSHVESLDCAPEHDDLYSSVVGQERHESDILHVEFRGDDVWF